MAYTIKSVKTFRGMEGHGFNVTLLRDGKKVALVMDEGCGGEARFEWVDYAMPKVDVPWTNYGQEPISIRCTPEEATLYEFLRGKTCQFDTLTLSMNPDLFIGELLTKYENDKRFARLCKTKTIFHLRSDPVDSWRKFNSPFNKRMKDLIVEKYGNQVDEIMNEILGQVAV